MFLVFVFGGRGTSGVITHYGAKKLIVVMLLLLLVSDREDIPDDT